MVSTCSSCTSFSRKDVAAVAEGDTAARSVIGTIPSARAFNVHNSAQLQPVLGNTPAHQRARRLGGKSPSRDVAAFVRDIDVEPDMRILPLYCLDRASDADWIGGIKFRCFGMVPEAGCSKRHDCKRSH